jgi:hypothetical protein
MTLMKDVETAICKGDGLAQQPPAAQLMPESGQLIDLLRYNLRNSHEQRLDSAVFY